MCVIISKNKGQEIPSKEFLRKAWNSNPDGCGFAYNFNNKVYICKGFMDFNKFYDKLTIIDKIYNLKNRDVVFHFRIATHGKVEPLNTHPFLLPANNEKFVNKNEMSTTNGCFFHNGILYRFR